MNDHDISKSVMREKELLDKISPKFAELNADLDQIMEQSENPKVLAALMYRLTQERQKTNELLEGINDKFDKIMFSVKTGTTENNAQAQGFQQSSNNRFEVLPEQDQSILKIIEERGGASAKDIQAMLNYKGLNAACQRLNRLYRDGHVKKLQSGRKVLYLAKS